MNVPDNYVKSKCCHAYQDPSNTVCVRCGEPFQAEEAAEQKFAPDECQGCGAKIMLTMAFENGVSVCDACGTRR